MDREIRITKGQVKKLLEKDFDRLVERTVEAVNAAPAFRVIDASEEPVRAAAAEFRRVVFQTAIQERTKAAGAAFSPSGFRVAIQGRGGDSSSDQ